MDESVIAAMARWPDVPDVFGWMSLSENGHWRLHPNGDALLDADAVSSGEPISSTRIRNFINRNYTHDAYGRWFFQNGPQRVFVRLDAAPYILQTRDAAAALQTHTGLTVKVEHAWWLDDGGRLYAQTEHGPGLIAGRDLSAVLDSLHTADGQPLTLALEQASGALKSIAVSHVYKRGGADAAIPPNPEGAAQSGTGIWLKFCAAAHIPSELGFQRFPAKDPPSDTN